MCDKCKHNNVVFTFHYVSILMDNAQKYADLMAKFTFHYVSILMVIVDPSAAALIIYIPLCLYFNGLLSLMLSLPEDIYIPLCLYFNPSSPSLFIFFLFHPLSVDLSIAINILPYFSCFFYKIDGKCPIYRVF